MIRRMKVNAVLGSSLLLYEETSIIDFPYTVLFESFKLCNLLETVTNTNAMYTMKTPNADNNSCPPPLQYSILVDKNSQ